MQWRKKLGIPIGMPGYPKPEYGRNYVAMNRDGDIIAVTGKDYVTIATNVGHNWPQISIEKYGLNETDNGYSGSTVSLSGDGKRILIGSKCLNGKKFNHHVSQLYQNEQGNWKLKRNFTSAITSDYSCSSAKLSRDGRTVAISTFNPDLHPDNKAETEIYSAKDGSHIFSIPSGGISASLSGNGSQVAVIDIDFNIVLCKIGVDTDKSRIESPGKSSMSLSYDGQSIATAQYFQRSNGDKFLRTQLRVYNSTLKSWSKTDESNSERNLNEPAITDKTMPVVSKSCDASTYAVIDPHFDFGAIIRKSDIKNTFMTQFTVGMKPVAVAMNDNGNKFALSHKTSDGLWTITDIYEWPQIESEMSNEKGFSSILPVFAFISIAFWFFVRRR